METVERMNFPIVILFPVVFLFVVSFLPFAVGAQAGRTVKKETDKELRELVGPVREVRIVRELVESAEGDEIGDGWIPSLTIFNREGFVEEFHAYDDRGKFEYKSVSEFDASGNKVQEATYDAKGKLLRKTVMAYDASGNMIEVKNFHNPDGSLSDWIRYAYDREGEPVSHSYLDKKGRVTSVTKYSYDPERKEKEEVTYDAKGQLTHRAVHSFGDEQQIAVFNQNGVLQYRYVTLTDDKGNLTALDYDRDGTLSSKETYTYERDERGNWIKETASEWKNTDGRLAFVRTKITRRTITYY